MTPTEYNDTLHELAYESIKESELWNELETNGECDKAADELAAAIQRTIDAWVTHRTSEKDVTTRPTNYGRTPTAFPLRHAPLRSLTEAQESGE